MVRKIFHVVVIVALLASIHLGSSAPDWTRSDLTRNMNRMTQNMNKQTQPLRQNLHSQMQTVQRSFAKSSSILENLSRDARGRKIKNNGNLISMTFENGISRTVMSGRKPDGELYVRDIKEHYEGNVLYHNETSFNPITRATEKILWKLNLATPGAKPEILTDKQHITPRENKNNLSCFTFVLLYIALIAFFIVCNTGHRK